MVFLTHQGMHIRGTRAEKGNFHHSTLANISAHSDIQWVHFLVAFLVFLLAYDMMHSFKVVTLDSEILGRYLLKNLAFFQELELLK